MVVGAKPRGRPRGFDREDAIATAMRLFWRHGFEGVSTNMLTESMGIAPPSLYAAFGSKAGLYRAALDRYAEQAGSFDLNLLTKASTLSSALEQMFNAAIDAVTDPGGERGCMISTGLLATHADHAALAAELVARRRAFRDAIAFALRRWIPEQQAADMARYLTAVLQGMAVQARDGATSEELEAIASIAVQTAARRHNVSDP